MMHALREHFLVLKKEILNGLSQIMLQENQDTGLLFLVGIFLGSWKMGLAALLSVIIGTLTARIFRFDHAAREKGLYGFSAALTGVALMLFLQPVLMTWLLVVAGSVAATVVQHFFIKRNIPAFTLPFVLVTWLIIYLAPYFFQNIVQQQALPVVKQSFYLFAVKGFGQVIFQDQLLCGLIFFIAVYISSPVAALYGLAGSLVGGLLAWCFSMPLQDISIGVFSFNAVLCSIALAGKTVRAGAWALLSVLLSVAISLLMYHYYIIPLTFPFVAATCITSVLKKVSR